MENRPLGPEEQDENTESTGTKKKRGSKLSVYLSALRGKEVSAVNAENSDTEKPKRMQRLFKRLFPGIVERPNASASTEGSQEEPEHEFNHEVWRNITRFASRDEETPRARPETEEAGSGDTSLGSPGTTPEVTPEEGQARHVESEDAVDVDSGTVDDTLQAPEGPELPVVPPVEHTGPVEEVIVPLLERQRDIDELTAPQSRPERIETVVEHRGGNALPVALVAAEYIGRKRADKKLEARTERRIQNTRAEQQKRNDLLQQELEQVVAENRRQIDQLKSARVNMVERRESVKAPEQAPERRTKSTLERQPRIEHRAETGSSRVESVQPQNIAERVADAAEHDMPVERAFERSHEVKDDMPNPSNVGGAASVGSVVASSATAANSYVNLAKASAGKEDLPFVSDEAAKEFYKRAAARGFWSAVCLIILGAIAYLVVK